MKYFYCRYHSLKYLYCCISYCFNRFRRKTQR